MPPIDTRLTESIHYVNMSIISFRIDASKNHIPSMMCVFPVDTVALIPTVDDAWWLLPTDVQVTPEALNSGHSVKYHSTTRPLPSYLERLLAPRFQTSPRHNEIDFAIKMEVFRTVVTKTQTIDDIHWVVGWENFGRLKAGNATRMAQWFIALDYAWINTHKQVNGNESLDNFLVIPFISTRSVVIPKPSFP